MFSGYIKSVVKALFNTQIALNNISCHTNQEQNLLKKCTNAQKTLSRRNLSKRLGDIIWTEKTCKVIDHLRAIFMYVAKGILNKMYKNLRYVVSCLFRIPSNLRLELNVPLLNSST